MDLSWVNFFIGFNCYDINVKAYLKGICSWCAKESKPSIDYCAIGWMFFLLYAKINWIYEMKSLKINFKM
jgi:hypothetical protein